MSALASPGNHQGLRRPVKHSYTILLVGNPRVGKSSLMHRFVGKYSEYVDPGSRGIEQKNIVIGNDSLVRIVVHDMDPNFHSMLESYYNFAVGIFLIYAIDDRQSFDSLVSWLEHFQIYGQKDSVVTIIGAKTDLEGVRQVSKDDAAKFARNHGFSFMEVSAKAEMGIGAAFRITACDIFSRVHEGRINPDRVRVEAGNVRFGPACPAEEVFVAQIGVDV